ncbi:MAG TPA: DUF87 domain-containing protein [Candidatus Saccharimonadales bacterium]|nr:DUF87 domain-containing protein [Candidatus Saccharimonadales bacterium]
MKKQLLSTTNGFRDGGHLNKPQKKKSKLHELEEMKIQVEQLISEEKGKKTTEEMVTKVEVSQKKNIVKTILTTVNIAMLKKLHKDNATLTSKKKELEKEKQRLEKLVSEKNEEIKQLFHTISYKDRCIKRTFSSSQILQLVEPTFLIDRNPLKFTKNYFEYQKKKREYNLQVRNVAKYPMKFITDQEGLHTTIDTDGTKKFKVNFLQVQDKHIKIGERFVKLYYLADVPAEFSELVYFKLLASPIPFHISLFVKPTPNGDILKKARRRISALEALQAQREKKGQVRDPQIDKNIEQTMRLADDITYERERALIYSFYIALEAESLQELTDLEKQFKNDAEGMELVFNTYSFGQEKAFKNLLPFAVDNVKEDMVVQSSAGSLLMPFVSKPLYDPKGIFLGTNVYHNSVVFINPFTPRNNNINIFGVSGAGKSVTSKILASRMFMQGTQIIIVDPEGEYVKLARQLGGEVIQFSRENGINPFYVYGKTDDEMLSHISTLKTFFKFFIPEETYNSATLDEILIKLYKKSKKQNFDELLKLLKGNPMREYLKVLYEGSLQGIFTSERKLELDSDFIVFDLSELKKDEKRAPAMYLLTSLLWSLVNNMGNRRRMLFIDEAHMLLTDHEVAEFYRQLVKVARKRDLGVVSITQDVEDFLDNELGKAIITNSETKILLKQSYATLGLMDKIYPMTPEEKKSLGNMRKGEVVIFREDEHIGAYIQVLPSERTLVLTQQSDNHEDN